MAISPRLFSGTVQSLQAGASLVAMVWRRGAAAAPVGAPHTQGQSGDGLVDFWKLSPVGVVR